MSTMERVGWVVAILGGTLAISAGALIALAYLDTWLRWLSWVTIPTTPYTTAGVAGGGVLVVAGGVLLRRVVRRGRRSQRARSPRAARGERRRPVKSPWSDEGRTVEFRPARVALAPRGDAGRAAQTAVLPRVPSAAPRRRHPVPAGPALPLGSAGTTPTQVFPSPVGGVDGERASAGLPSAETVILPRVRAREVRHLGATPAAQQPAGGWAGGDQGWTAAGPQFWPQVKGPRREHAEGLNEITRQS